MGLRNTFQSLAQTIIKSFGDVPIECEYKELTANSYSASTGAHTVTYTTYSSVPIIFNAFKLEEIDGVAVQPEDQTAYMAAKDADGVTPEPDDIIEKEGIEWKVVSARTDPASALWILHIRRP